MKIPPIPDNVYQHPEQASLTDVSHLAPHDRQCIEELREIFPSCIDNHLYNADPDAPNKPCIFSTLLGSIMYRIQNQQLDLARDTLPTKLREMLHLYSRKGNVITTIHIRFGIPADQNRNLPSRWNPLNKQKPECPVKKFTMPPSFRHLQYLGYLWLDHVPITSFAHFPSVLPHLHTMIIRNSRLRDCEGFPARVPRLERLDLSGNRLRSLIGLPRVLPACTWLSFKANRLRNVHGFPRCPQVEQVHLDQNLFPNFAYDREIPSKIPSQALLYGSGNPKISLHGLQPDLVQCVWRTPPADLPASYRAALHAAYSWPFDRTAHTRIPAAIANLFAPAPTALAFRYIAEKSSTASEPPRSSTPGSSAGEPPLSDFERDRIVYEGDLTTLRVLLDHLPLDDPVLTALARHLEVPLQRGKFLI